MQKQTLQNESYPNIQRLHFRAREQNIPYALFKHISCEHELEKLLKFFKIGREVVSATCDLCSQYPGQEKILFDQIVRLDWSEDEKQSSEAKLTHLISLCQKALPKDLDIEVIKQIPLDTQIEYLVVFAAYSEDRSFINKRFLAQPSMSTSEIMFMCEKRSKLREVELDQGLLDCFDNHDEIIKVHEVLVAAKGMVGFVNQAYHMLYNPEVLKDLLTRQIPWEVLLFGLSIEEGKYYATLAKLAWSREEAENAAFRQLVSFVQGKPNKLSNDSWALLENIYGLCSNRVLDKPVYHLLQRAINEEGKLCEDTAVRLCRDTLRKDCLLSSELLSKKYRLKEKTELNAAVRLYHAQLGVLEGVSRFLSVSIVDKWAREFDFTMELARMLRRAAIPIVDKKIAYWYARLSIVSQRTCGSYYDLQEAYLLLPEFEELCLHSVECYRRGVRKTIRELVELDQSLGRFGRVSLLSRVQLLKEGVDASIVLSQDAVIPKMSAVYARLSVLLSQDTQQQAFLAFHERLLQHIWPSRSKENNTELKQWYALSENEKKVLEVDIERALTAFLKLGYLHGQDQVFKYNVASFLLSDVQFEEMAFDGSIGLPFFKPENVRKRSVAFDLGKETAQVTTKDVASWYEHLRVICRKYYAEHHCSLGFIADAEDQRLEASALTEDFAVRYLKAQITNLCMLIGLLDVYLPGDYQHAPSYFSRSQAYEKSIVLDILFGYLRTFVDQVGKGTQKVYEGDEFMHPHREALDGTFCMLISGSLDDLDSITSGDHNVLVDLDELVKASQKAHTNWLAPYQEAFAGMVVACLEEENLTEAQGNMYQAYTQAVSKSAEAQQDWTRLLADLYTFSCGSSHTEADDMGDLAISPYLFSRGAIWLSYISDLDPVVQPPFRNYRWSEVLKYLWEWHYTPQSDIDLQRYPFSEINPASFAYRLFQVFDQRHAAYARMRPHIQSLVKGVKGYLQSHIKLEKSFQAHTESARKYSKGQCEEAVRSSKKAVSAMSLSLFQSKGQAIGALPSSLGASR